MSIKVKEETLHIDQPKKKALFLRSLREQKFSNANFRGENSARFRVSSRRPTFSPRDFAETRVETPRPFAEFLRELLRSFSAKFRADSLRKHGFI